MTKCGRPQNSNFFQNFRSLFSVLCDESRGGGTGGGGGGQGGHGPPPQKSEWEGQGMFWPPPKILATGPPKMGASGCQIASEDPEMGKIFKIFCLRRLMREELISLEMLGCTALSLIDYTI